MMVITRYSSWVHFQVVCPILYVDGADRIKDHFTKLSIYPIHVEVQLCLTDFRLF